MPAIKPLDQISAKWIRVSELSAPSYEEGLKSTTVDWKTQTAAASAIYKTSMQAVIANDSFNKGVARSSTENWRTKALAKGVTRWPEGIRTAAQAYAAGFGPYRDAIANLVLPPRGAKGDPKNIDRVRMIAQKLFDTKKQLAGRTS